ncbi:MAG: hypothetical protein JNN12_11990 [Bacteroidetes Order II. Incertae sedis bacterium]|nr:hypothetical protein [Bacteroidetes Order II. bacterium]
MKQVRSIFLSLLMLGVLVIMPGCDTPAVVDVAPVGDMISPKTGNVVGRMVRVWVQAQAINTDALVEKVLVSVNGVEIGEASRLTAGPKPIFEYIWDSTGRPDGSYQLQAAITDSEGARTITLPQSVVVNNGNGAGPRVAITSHTTGQQVRGVIQVDATAQEPTPIQSVSLLLNGVQVSTDASDPYNFFLDTRTLPIGMHVLQPKSVGTNGSIRYGTTVTVNVTGG